MHLRRAQEHYAMQQERKQGSKIFIYVHNVFTIDLILYAQTGVVAILLKIMHVLEK